MDRFLITYDIITPESAEQGDAAERGVMHRHGFHFPIETAGNPWAQALSLSEAVSMIGCVEDGGDGYSFYECDGRQDYQTGNWESRTLHIADSVTPSSASRIRRYLRNQGLLTQ